MSGLDGGPVTAGAETFAATFYDHETARRFCRNSAMEVGRSDGKTAREARCLSRLLRGAPWRGLVAGRAVDLVDLGAGSGSKAAMLVSALRACGASPLGYFPVDTSPYCIAFATVTMLAATASSPGALDLALATLLPFVGGERSALADVGIREAVAEQVLLAQPSAPIVVTGDVRLPSEGIWGDFVHDIEGVWASVRASPACVGGTAVAALLGQTVGNHDSTARTALLERLFEVLREGDVILLDAGICPEAGGPALVAERTRSLERAYEVEALRFMGHKADSTSSRLRVAYDPVTQRVDHRFERADGTTQPLGYSQLFGLDVVPAELERIGFQTHDVCTTFEVGNPGPGTDCLVVLAQKPVRRRRGGSLRTSQEITRGAHQWVQLTQSSSL